MLMATVIIYLAALIGIALMYAYFTEVCSIYFIHSYVLYPTLVYAHIWD